MTPEIYTIIAVGIALAGLILNGQRSISELRKGLKELRVGATKPTSQARPARTAISPRRLPAKLPKLFPRKHPGQFPSQMSPQGYSLRCMHFLNTLHPL